MELLCICHKGNSIMNFIITFLLDRRSHWRCFVRKNVLRNFAKFTEKHLCQTLFFNKVAGILRKGTVFTVFYRLLLLNRTPSVGVFFSNRISSTQLWSEILFYTSSKYQKTMITKIFENFLKNYLFGNL